eukprot:TRINITY_DN4687_c0_g1_i1.p1 TRINITY_DN4687_c0_g1~~TRINITY_DN4687_c0_g1_i1.p1  ORF type:complete len:232 (-),score=48.40 TRINITY_DN4687_c0_g1_i1:23-718(-)
MRHTGFLKGAQEEWKRENMLGTSIMACEFEGGVVVGADSRTTTGSYISNRASDKLTPMHDKIYCCRSGSAADTQAISDYVTYYLDLHTIESGEAPLVSTAASLVQQLCYNNKDRLLAGMIVAGWDEMKGGQVYSIPLGGYTVRQPYAIGGSGSTYIFAFCDAYYKENMSREESEKFVVLALAHAMARDGSSGGLIRTAVIDKDGVKRNVILGDQLPYELDKGLNRKSVISE